MRAGAREVIFPRARFESGLRVGLVASAVTLAALPVAARVRRSWRWRVAVVGDSMTPQLRPGEWLLVDPEGYAHRSPRAGELVVVPDPREEQRWLIKRVAAVAPDGDLFVVGDATEHSTDSRAFGAVPPGRVIGRPWARYWPLRRAGWIG